MPILFMISTGSILAAGVSVLVGLGFMMIFIPVLKACFRTRRSEAERMFSYSGALFIVLALAIASVAALSHLSGGATDGKAYAKTLVVRR